MVSTSTAYGVGSTPPRSPPSRGYSRRSSIASSSASTSHGADPFANPSSSWYRPTSPTTSTLSGGSPRSFYSAAQASTSEAGHGAQHWNGQSNLKQVSRNDSSLFEDEDDIGDVTITHGDHDTPLRSQSRDRKGKATESRDDYGEDTRLYGQEVEDDDTEEALGGPDESQRVEENLRRWAEKEKLRRAKTRSRYASPQKQSYSNGPFTIDSGSAVTHLVRRVSIAGKRLSKSRPGQHSRTGSQKLRSTSSKDNIFGDGSRLVEVEEVELQPQSFRSSSATRESADPFSQAQPLSATSATFPERIERAVKTGSRFIEDLEDQEMPKLMPGQPEPETYAQLSSNPPTPLASPTKTGTPRSRRKPFLKLGDLRNSMHQSRDSTDTQRKSGWPQAPGTISGQSTPTMLSPTAYAMPKQYYEESADTLAARLVSPTYKTSEYDRQYSLDDELDDLDSDRPVGWLEWFFCCGCFGSGVRLDDEQAGRTFPE